ILFAIFITTVRAGSGARCVSGSGFHTVGCEERLLAWLRHTADILFVLGYCVIAFLKLCFLGILSGARCVSGSGFHTVGCEERLLAWLRHTADILFVLGYCVIAFLKLCFLGSLSRRSGSLKQEGEDEEDDEEDGEEEEVKKKKQEEEEEEEEEEKEETADKPTFLSEILSFLQKTSR
ncbi:hypothetical protein LSTR_LSTR013036, partial [Laodelphax striatellus]